MLSVDFCQSFIADFHERELPQLTPRDLTISYLPRKATSLIGVRRSGKTFYLYQLMHDLLKTGVDKTQFLFIDFEDERLGSLSATDLQTFVIAHKNLYPHLSDRQLYLFLDEVQNVENWEQFVRRMQETERAQVFITGSSAKLLSKEIATSLRGRTLTYEVFPFSFHEYLTHFGLSTHSKSQANQAKITHAMATYLKHGGFPETLGQTEEIFRLILQEYLNLIIYRDLIERHRIHNPKLIKLFIHTLLRNIAAPLSINKLHRDFTSQGYTLSKDTLHLYLSYLEEAYAFFTVELFSESIRAQQDNYRKIYVIDTGFVTANIFGISEKRGALLENTVFLALRRLPGGRLHYYRTKTQQEVDFIWTERGDIRALIQVSETLADHNTRTRELEGLSQAMDELEQRHAWIISLHESSTVSLGKKTITMVPIAEFCSDPSRFLNQEKS